MINITYERDNKVTNGYKAIYGKYIIHIWCVSNIWWIKVDDTIHALHESTWSFSMAKELVKQLIWRLDNET